MVGREESVRKGWPKCGSSGLKGLNEFLDFGFNQGPGLELFYLEYHMGVVAYVL